jgi:Cys-tRNA(Pro)/Cys-tRNA(Cys) deacylase
LNSGLKRGYIGIAETMTKASQAKTGVFTRALKELSGAEIPYRVMTFKAEEKSAEEVTRETGFPLARVVKILLVQGASKKYYLALCPGDRQVNLKTLAKVIDEKTVDMAKREEVPRITGYFIGGVSPIGTHRPLPVVLEQSILAVPEISVSAGQWGCQAILKPSDLLKHLGNRAIVASFAQFFHEG